MPVDIDELSLQIAADSTKADTALIKLVQSLGMLRSSLGLSTDRFGEFHEALGTAERLFNDFASRIRGTKIDLDFKFGNRTEESLRENIDAAIEKVSSTIDSSAIADKLAADFGVTTKSVRDTFKKEMDELLRDTVQSFDGETVKISSNMEKAFEDMWDLIGIHGEKAFDTDAKAAERASSEYLDLIRYLQKVGISLNEVRTAYGSNYAEEWGQNMRFVKEGGEEASKVLDWMAENCKNLASEALMLTDSLHPVEVILAHLKLAVAEFKAKPIFDQDDMGQQKAFMALQDFEQQFKNMAVGMRDQLKNAFDSFTTGVPINVQVNEEAITYSIVKSIKRAVSMVSEPLNVNIQVNTKHLREQLKEKIGKIDLGNLPELTAALEKLNSIDSSNILKIGQAFGELGSAKMKKAAENLKSMAPALESLAAQLVNLSFVDFGSEQFTAFATAIGNLGKASIQKAITAIPQLTEALRDMLSTLANAPQVTENTLELVKTLGSVGPVARSFKAVTQQSKGGLFSGIASGAKKAGKSIADFGKKLLGTNNPIKKMRANLRNLLRAILPILGIRQLFQWGKQAVEIASDLTEVQNVVDVTFQDMSGKVDEFTKTSIEGFGITELSAKRTASTFQAMGAAMGIANSQVRAAGDFLSTQNLEYGELSENIADVSINLTKLSADMASFYNKDQADVAEDLQAVFTGMARPLRKYGVDLTQATLQEWALKNGLDADVQSMTQAQKTMLRYQYVMSNLGFAQKDFQVTSGNWANQVRVLKQQLEDLGKTVGTIVINTFKPFVAGMNNVLASVRKFVTEVLNALGQIFGWTIEITSGGSTFEDMADGAEDLADGLGDAADAAKKAKNTILAFDELNVLNGDDNSSKSGGGSGGDALAAGLAGAEYQLRRTDGVLKKYESEIKTLQKLGEKFAKSIRKSLKSIDWDSFRENMGRAGLGLADFFNGLNDPETFGEIGNAFAQSVNGVINFGYTAISRFDSSKFGKAISSLIQNGINNINWTRLQQTLAKAGERLAEYLNNIVTPDTASSLGTALGNIIQGGITFALNTVKRIDWKKWGQSIGTFISTAISKIKPSDVFETIVTGFGGLGTMLGAAIAKIKWNHVLELLLAGIAGIMDGLIRGIVNLITEVAPELGNWIKTNLLPEQIGQPIKESAPDTIADSLAESVKSVATNVGLLNEAKKVGEKVSTSTGEGIMKPPLKDPMGLWLINDVFKRTSVGQAVEQKERELAENVQAVFFKFFHPTKEQQTSAATNWANALTGPFGSITGAIVGQTTGEKTAQALKKSANSSEVKDSAKVAATTLGDNVSIGFGNTLLDKLPSIFKKDLAPAIDTGMKQSSTIGVIQKWFGSNGTIAEKMKSLLLTGETSLLVRVGQWFQTSLGKKIGAGISSSGVLTKFSEWFGVNGKIAEKLKSYILNGDNALLPRIQNWFTNHIGKYIGSGISKSGLTSRLSEWFGSSGVVQEKMKGYILDNNNSIIKTTGNKFGLMPKAISDAVSDWSWISRWSSATQTNIDKQASPIQRAVTAIFSSLVGSDAEPYLQMWSAGDWAAAGLWNGMNYNYNWLLGKVAGFADSMISTVKKVFKIGSPSKVMEDIGAFWTEGLEIGIESGFGDVYSSVNGFSARLANMQIATPQLSNRFSPLPIGLDNTTVGVGFDMESLQDAVISGVEIALSNQQDRPVNVYATLKTENDEVLARAVTRGQKSIDYRNNPTPAMA